jgi:hypothetical protein
MPNTSDSNFKPPTGTPEAIAACLQFQLQKESAQRPATLLYHYERALMQEGLPITKAHVLIETPTGEFVARHEFDTNQEAADLLTSLMGRPYNVTYKAIGMKTDRCFMVPVEQKNGVENETILDIVLDNF